MTENTNTAQTEAMTEDDMLAAALATSDELSGVGHEDPLAATDVNAVAVGGGAAPVVPAKKAKPKSTISKADLTQEFAAAWLEPRTDKFVMDFAAGLDQDPTPRALPADGSSVEFTNSKGVVKTASYSMTAAECEEVLVFENLYWLQDTAVALAGSVAGTRRPADGYYSVVLRGTNYSGSQLSHFIKTGEWISLRKPADPNAASRKIAAAPRAVKTFVPFSPAAIAAAKNAEALKNAAKAAAGQKQKNVNAAAAAAAAAAPAVNTDDLADLGSQSDL